MNGCVMMWKIGAS